jgi:RNA 3'-terminal phosphate cyclase
MLIPAMALAGNSKITTSEITEHTKTNIWLLEQFIKKKFLVKDNLININ